MTDQLRADGDASPASPAPAAALHRVALPEARPLSPPTSPPAPTNRQDDAESEPDAEDKQDAEVMQEEEEATAPAEGDAEAAALKLAATECCARLCLRAPATESGGGGEAPRASESLRHLLASLAAMTKAEKKVCMLTSLSISSLVKPAPQRAPRPREGGAKARSRFAYWLPLVGEVCRAAFLAVFGVSHCSLTRFRKQLVADQRLVPPPHGNARNSNAKKLDDALLASWFRAFAARVGEPVTVRVRVRRAEGGQRKSSMVEQRHVQLPARFTWEQLLREFSAHAEREAPHAKQPSLASFRRILSDKCPDIRLGGAASATAKVKADA